MFTHINSFNQTELSRRQFLQGSVGLVIALSLPMGKFAVASEGGSSNKDKVTDPNAFVQIAPDNTVTVYIKHIEIGQGAFTGLATLVAEEMDADWSQMRAEHAPANTQLYSNYAFGIQGVGGSTGLSNSYMQMRQAGAGAKAMLVAAAAQKWGVPTEDITVSKGKVSHARSGKEASFGELAELASQQTPPQSVTLKTPDQFILIGTDVPRLDSDEKSNGNAVFTQDMMMDGMLVAVVAHSPAFGASVTSFNDANARKVPGVVAVKQIPSGVAVLAESTYAAIKGRDALDVKWDLKQAETRSSQQIMDEYKQAVNQHGTMAVEQGDVAAALDKVKQTESITFEFPYLVHAPMETLDAVVRHNEDGTVDVWMGSQLQTVDQGTVASVFGVKPDRVSLHTLYGGGTFGRRAQPDSGLAAEAAQIAKTVKAGTPVKLIWTREDDIQGGRYRPLTVHKIDAGLDDNGEIVAWQQVVATQSIVAGSPFEQMIQNGIDPTSIEGVREVPYNFKARNLSLHTMTNPVPVLWWRSVGHTHTGYALEVMIDHLLEKAGKDPVEGRLALMDSASRDAGVLKAVADAAEKAGPAPKGSARGVAVHKSFGSYVAQIAEVTKGADNFPKVTKVWCAVDCGIAVNRNVVTMQMESGIGFGLGAILREELVLNEGGTISQSNFDTYQPLRIQDMPEVEVIIVQSNESPTGVGEPGTPPIGPAVANAWRRLTGQMITRLPFARHLNETAREA